MYCLKSGKENYFSHPSKGSVITQETKHQARSISRVLSVPRGSERHISSQEIFPPAESKAFLQLT